MDAWPFTHITPERFTALTADELEMVEALTLTILAQMERMRLAEAEPQPKDT